MRSIEAGYMFIVEISPTAAETDYLHPVLSTPGTGACQRSDGLSGPLSELIPTGWVLIDHGYVVEVGPAGDEIRHHIHIILDPTTVWASPEIFLNSTWAVREGQLVETRLER